LIRPRVTRRTLVQENVDVNSGQGYGIMQEGKKERCRKKAFLPKSCVIHRGRSDRIALIKVSKKAVLAEWERNDKHTKGAFLLEE